MEQWKEIIGYEGLYLISNLGRVKSVARAVKKSDGKTQRINERIMGFSCRNGYLSVNLSKNGLPEGISVHRLVALHFIKNNMQKPEVNHKNKNKSDNRQANLEWVTKSENIIHSWSGRKTKRTRGHLKVIHTDIDEYLFESFKAHLASRNERIPDGIEAAIRMFLGAT